MQLRRSASRARDERRLPGEPTQASVASRERPAARIGLLVHGADQGVPRADVGPHGGRPARAGRGDRLRVAQAGRPAGRGGRDARGGARVLLGRPPLEAGALKRFYVRAWPAAREEGLTNSYPPLLTTTARTPLPSHYPARAAGWRSWGLGCRRTGRQRPRPLPSHAPRPAAEAERARLLRLRWRRRGDQLAHRRCFTKQSPLNRRTYGSRRSKPHPLVHRVQVA
jgi:hypothetical protein